MFILSECESCAEILKAERGGQSSYFSVSSKMAFRQVGKMAAFKLQRFSMELTVREFDSIFEVAPTSAEGRESTFHNSVCGPKGNPWALVFLYEKEAVE